MDYSEFRSEVFKLVEKRSTPTNSIRRLELWSSFKKSLDYPTYSKWLDLLCYSKEFQQKYFVKKGEGIRMRSSGMALPSSIVEKTLEYNAFKKKALAFYEKNCVDDKFIVRETFYKELSGVNYYRFSILMKMLQADEDFTKKFVANRIGIGLKSSPLATRRKWEVQFTKEEFANIFYKALDELVAKDVGKINNREVFDYLVKTFNFKGTYLHFQHFASAAKNNKKFRDLKYTYGSYAGYGKKGLIQKNNLLGMKPSPKKYKTKSLISYEEFAKKALEFYSEACKDGKFAHRAHLIKIFPELNNYQFTKFAMKLSDSSEFNKIFINKRRFGTSLKNVSICKLDDSVVLSAEEQTLVDDLDEEFAEFANLNPVEVHAPEKVSYPKAKYEAPKELSRKVLLQKAISDLSEKIIRDSQAQQELLAELNSLY